MMNFIQYHTVAIFLIFGIVNISCNSMPNQQYIIVSDSVHIAANSIVLIKSPETISTPYYVNTLCLQPSEPNRLLQHLEKGFGILSSDGKQLFTPKVLLRNDNGDEDLLEPNGYQGGIDGQFICFTLKRINDHEIYHNYHSPYSTVAITSPYDLFLKKITWFSGNK